MPLITVFTPTYNRAALLTRVFYSLCQQTYQDFEWIVVDDGSTDDTENEVLHFKEQSKKFLVRYIKKRNGGKHTAINMGVREAKGELFLILDSDDSLPKDSLQNIVHAYECIQDNMAVGGICGCMAHHDGSKIGNYVGQGPLDMSSLEMRYKFKITGDLCEVFKTEILRSFPFPEIMEENFCPEALVWNRIANRYKLRMLDKVLYYRDYLDGGLTSKMTKIRMQNPIATCQTYSELLDYNIPFGSKVKASINFCRFHPCLQGVSSMSIPFLWNIFRPIGLLMHHYDKRKVCK